MTSRPKTRVLQVGCGAITGNWFGPATQMDDLEYAGLCDLNIEAARKRRDEFGLPSDTPIFTDLATALRELRPTACSIASFPRRTRQRRCWRLKAARTC